MSSPSQSSFGNPSRPHAGLVDVITPVIPVAPETTSGDVYNRFRQDPELISVPVVDGETPVGLVYRHTLTMSLAHKYGNALYADKSVANLMDAHPLIVAHSMTVDDLEWVIANEKPSALMRGFIVTRDGRYAGVASALSLLRLSMARSERHNRELEEARSRAEAASQAKSQFLTIMTHELRTPLNAIIGFTDLMEAEMFGRIEPGRYREYIHDINDAAKQLLTDINDVLDMAKIEQGKMELHEEPVDLKDEIAAALRVVTERAQSSDLRLTTDMPASTVVLRSDRRALRHVLLNLLSNAIKFTPAGGSVTVRLNVLQTGGIELAVSDTGIGMSEEHVAIALTPFAQVENVYTRKHEGTGLGLPLVKSIVELHGGRLEIDSRLGEGTTIRIYFRPERVVEPAPPRIVKPYAWAS